MAGPVKKVEVCGGWTIDKCTGIDMRGKSDRDGSES